MKKILLLLITAILITFMTPNRALIDLNFQKGEIWSEETLVAPFDIPIFKSNISIKEEKEEIINNFQPIFRIDTVISNRKIESFLSVLKREVDDQSVIDSISSILRKASSVGIIPSTEASKYKDRIIRVSDNHNNLTTVPVAELYTPELLSDRLSVIGVAANRVVEYIQPNLTYNDKLNQEIRENELNNISTTRSMIRAGETIITTGQVIDEQTFQVLKSFRLEYETQIGLSSGIYVILLGRFLLILIILLVNFQFFTSFADNYFGKSSKPWLFVMILYLMMAGLTAIVVNIKGVSPYVVPLPIVAMYLMNYFNMRVAILGNISAAIICSLFVRIPFDFFIVNFVAGMAAIFMMRHHYHRYNLFRAIGVIFIAQVLVWLCVSLLREADVFALKYHPVIWWFLLNVFLILGLYQAVYLIERLFGFVSDVTLLELCDTNQPLLLQLAEKAPGTFQHSVQVANLAEAAAKEIGANPLLARTGALYHDLGKMENPFYYAENQSGEFNPHVDMTPLESVSIIRKHVSDGVAIATKNRLPQQIIDFMEGHHGTSKMYYFYSKQVEKYGKIEDETTFSYHGPRPISKEVSICMMADAVEASSRSLKSYDKEPLEALVDKIIDIQIEEHQLDESELSFHEVGMIKALFKAKLNTIYHVRISYPERKQQA